MNDHQEREWRRQINGVLRRVWNPIGDDVPESEYETYVGVIAAMLWHSASDSELIEQLKWAEKDQMGLGGSFSQERAQNVIAALRALKVPGRP
jgi:hypothetical protein